MTLKTERNGKREPYWSASGQTSALLSLCQLSLGWELPVPFAAPPAALLTGGRRRPQRTRSSGSLPPHKSIVHACHAWRTGIACSAERLSSASGSLGWVPLPAPASAPLRWEVPPAPPPGSEPSTPGPAPDTPAVLDSRASQPAVLAMAWKGGASCPDRPRCRCCILLARSVHVGNGKKGLENTI